MEIASRCSHDTVTGAAVCLDSNPQFKRKRSASSLMEQSLVKISDEEEKALISSSPLPKRPKVLRIEIPSSLNSSLHDAEISAHSRSSLFSASDADSLFDGLDDIHSARPLQDDTVALRTAPPIPGLFFEPLVTLPQELADLVMAFCMKTYFLSPADNQVMLFGRFLPSTSTLSTNSGLPNVLLDLLDKISIVLKPVVPPETYSLLFPIQPTKARQAIINLYQPGEGITPHVDLLGRYGDGIIGVSFSSGCVMRFDKVRSPSTDGTEKPSDVDARWDLYLPERSVIVLSEEARYGWTHGIDKKTKDFVSSAVLDGVPAQSASVGSWIDRRVRMSITFRWLLPGADVVGDDP